jgi:excisionase family DNA binding protein
VAQVLRYTRIMEATQSYPNLLSEKQAAKRLGVARITLLRAGESGRIRFFRIGTRVLYCADQLTEFLNGCERNRHKQSREVEGQAPRKENRVSSGPESADGRERARSQSKSGSRKKDQASLPFAASR